MNWCSLEQTGFIFRCSKIFTMDNGSTMSILCMRLVNERWRYTVTPSLIGLAHTHNDHWKYQHQKCREILRDFNNHLGLGHQFVEVSRNHRKPVKLKRNNVFSVNTVPGDGLRPLVMTKFGHRVFERQKYTRSSKVKWWLCEFPLNDINIQLIKYLYVQRWLCTGNFETLG